MTKEMTKVIQVIIATTATGLIITMAISVLVMLMKQIGCIHW